MQLNITVIIPTMNRPSSLERTLSFMAKGTDVPSEVIIVDQSTESVTKESCQKVAEKYRAIFSKVIYVYQEEPSLTKARNNGLQYATNDIIVYSDDDIDVRSETFGTIAKLMSDDTISLIGGFTDTEPAKNSLMGYLFFMSSYTKRYIGHMSLGIYGKFPLLRGPQIPTEWAMGFFFVVRRSLMEKWNIRFDENLKYYAYAEDLDFTFGYYLKSKIENLKCIMSDLITVTHNVSTEYRIPLYKEIVMVVLHREYIRYKYFPGLLYYIAYSWSNLGMLLYRLIKMENLCDYIRALLFLRSNIKDVRKGNFHYSDYM